MWGKLFRWGVFLLLLGGGIFWGLTRPETISEDNLAGLSSDAEAGGVIFHAAGCASCHAAPEAKGEAKLILSGGQAFPSPFGTFLAPNISQDKVHGIGGWSVGELASAVIKGTSPEGQHYFPAFPYTSYAKMTLQDAADLHGFLRTLPADATPSQPHDIGFPFNIRRSLGIWKALFASEDYRSNWMTGAPDPSGKGRVPGITPAVLGWSAADIEEYLSSGFTPEFDTAGGHMVEVIENTALLSQEDRAAIAAYLLALP